MFEWLKKKFREYNKWSHIGKYHCFVFPILPKNKLEDGEYYETFDFSHKYNKRKEWWHTEYTTTSASWCAEKDCFISAFEWKVRPIPYEEFKPLRKRRSERKEINYGICSYNPCDINALDLEELKNITFNTNDDNAESDEVWDKLITYFEERGLND